MTKKKVDDSPYAPVPGFPVPLKRVLGMDERKLDKDGNRTGSMFMTFAACTFTHDGVKGDIASCVGSGSLVVTIGNGGAAVEGSNGTSRYLVDIHDVIAVAVKAHKARVSTKR